MISSNPSGAKSGCRLHMFHSFACRVGDVFSERTNDKVAV
jgi:hypothetical protein